MEVEQRFRDFLSGLDGGNSPNTWRNKDSLIEGIVGSKIKEIAQLYTIQLLVVGPMEYTFVTDKVFKYDYTDFQNHKIQFIDEKDLEFEIDAEKNYEIQMVENRLLLPSMNSVHKDNLFHDLVRKKNLSNHSVFCRHVLFGSTYKIELYASQDYSALPIEELRLKYIGSYIRGEVSKFRSELKKYPEPNLYKGYFKLIEFYRDKLSNSAKTQIDKNISACYKLTYEMLNSLLNDLKDYFESTDEKPAHSEKLEWRESISHFTEFFDNLIRNKKIQYHGAENRRAIYTILLHHITVYRDDKPANIDDIEGIESSESSIKDSIFKSDKIDFKLYGIKAFCNEFRSIILPKKPEDSILVYNNKVSLSTIAKELYKIFVILKQKEPHTPVKPDSFEGEFPKKLHEVQSESKSE